MWRPSRRAVLAGSACLLAGAGTAAAEGVAASSGPGLGELAARSGRFFGTAVTSTALAAADAYADLLDRECSVWVPEWQLKWGALVGDPADAPAYGPVDAIVAAARRRGKRLRGHTLIWHEHLPERVRGLSGRGDWDRIVAPHILAVAGRYRDAFFQWDVVNEAVEPRDGGGDLMRRSPFYAMRGPDYVADAFALARRAAPEGRLYLCDYGVCYAEGWQEARRTGVLRLLERLRAAGAPVDGFAIQGHLDVRQRFDERIFRRFIAELEGLGLELAISELDVREADGDGGRSLAERRQRAADEVAKVLAVALDSPALTGVVTWGLADDHSWLRKTRPIPDNQGLPYDDGLAPTAMRSQIAALLMAARSRT